MNLPVSNSLREYARGIAGGLMFSLPLLYTMEVWWTGFVAEPMRLLALRRGDVRAAARLQSLRRPASATLRWQEVVIDSVEEMGLGLLARRGSSCFCSVNSKPT